jgi:hypothetical protein
MSHNCIRCGRTFAYRSHLLRHQNRKTRCDAETQENSPCDICGAVFKTIYGRRRHVAAGKCKPLPTKNDYTIVPSCPDCGKGFASVSTRNRHVRAHCSLRKADQSVAGANKSLRAKYEQLLEYNNKLEALVSDQKEAIKSFELEQTRRCAPSAPTNVSRDAGRDINNTNITLNVYGGEDYDLRARPDLLNKLVDRVLLTLKQGKPPREVRDELLGDGVRELGRIPENRTVRGYDEARDKVGVHAGDGIWGEKSPGDVANDAVERVEKELWSAKPDLPLTKLDDDREEWVKKVGSPVLQGVAKMNAYDASGGSSVQVPAGTRRTFDAPAGGAGGRVV